MRIVEVTAQLLRSDGLRFEQQDVGDDLQAVVDAMLRLLQQKLLLPQQVLLLAFNSPALRYVLNDQQQLRARRFRMTNFAGIERHDAMTNVRKLVLDLQGIYRGLAWNHILQEMPKRRDVPLAIAEVKEHTADGLLGRTMNV